MKPFSQFTYKELVDYINELSTDLWQLKKAFDKFDELRDCKLYSAAINGFIDMIDEITYCLNNL